MPAEKYPGLAHIRDFWDRCPWTRVSFGAQWVIEPEGQYMLTTGAPRHFRKGEAKVFQMALEEALKRFIRIRSAERGSEEEARIVAQVEERIDQEWKTRHPYFVDPDLFTKEIFDADVRVESRFPGVLKIDEPSVRRQAAEMLGRYAAKYSPEFRPGGKYFFFGDGVAKLLDDPDASVRRAAAGALYQFEGKPVPPIDDLDELVSGARKMWQQSIESAAATTGEEAARKG